MTIEELKQLIKSKKKEIIEVRIIIKKLIEKKENIEKAREYFKLKRKELKAFVELLEIKKQKG